MTPNYFQYFYQLSYELDISPSLNLYPLPQKIKLSFDIKYMSIAQLIGTKI